jgi:hypothetical protein
MSVLSTDQRRALLAMTDELADPQDAPGVRRFYQSHGDACDAEFGARPGMDQVRATLLRAARGQPTEGLAPLAEAAAQALSAFPADLAATDASMLLLRHPAWVGLARLELGSCRAALGVSDDGALSEAIELARAGFQALDGAVSPGAVLWAMAEAAEEAGWLDRHGDLMTRAAEAPFEDEDRRAQVMLLHALSLAERGEPRARAALTATIAAPGADGQTRNHARWVLSALLRDTGDIDGAKAHLQAAIVDTDDADEPEVMERLVAARAALDA